MYTLGVLIGLPLVGVLVAVCAGLAVAFWRAGRKDANERDFLYGCAIGCIGVALVAVVATGFFMWPWKAEYHRWAAVEGKVTTVSSRLLPGASSGTEQKFVVVLDSHPGVAYGVQDTRAALLRPGDEVSLRCKRSYQYQAESGWDCRWNGGVPTGGES